MFKPEDISQISARGSQIEVVLQQVENFRNGFPYLRLIEAASNFHGILKLSEPEILKYSSFYDEYIAKGLKTVKFVPASGAATRMFKSLFTALENLQKGISISEVKKDEEILAFLNKLDQFSFYDDLKAFTSGETDSVKELPAQIILELILMDRGLNYGNLPKGLLKFHKYADGNRTSFEEHFAEGAMYARNSDDTVNLHFTISPEHQKLFEAQAKELIVKYEVLFKVSFQVSFSQQKPSSDTIAVTTDNEPFRNGDGSLLFRPAGHGALIENLNELEADLVFIKNIDNIVPDRLKKPTVDYKKALAGVLLSLQEQVFYYQKTLKENYPGTLDSAFYAEASNFLENVLHISPPQNQYYSEKEELYHYFKSKFNRPIRVCGMVKNTGEPGGGPFFALNTDGTSSLQIVESSQIDLNDPDQKDILRNASHFNPVDLVCAIKNFEGKKYNLLEFIDAATGFISIKSKDGKDLKAQELPGLWNGSMADWNTLFVEVPIETFNPVKTVNDLLRKEHQT
jgi:hypothetical protein